MNEFLAFLRSYWFLLAFLGGIVWKEIEQHFKVKELEGMVKNNEEWLSAMKKTVKDLGEKVQANDVQHADITTRLTHVEAGIEEIKDGQKVTAGLLTDILKSVKM